MKNRFTFRRMLQINLLTLFLGVIVLLFILGSLVSTSVSSYIMSRNTDSSALFMRTFLEPHVQSLRLGGSLSQADFDALTVIAQNEELRRHILTIKVWDTTGRVVFSTDPTIIGKQFPTDDLALPLAGQITSYLDNLSEEENENERALNRPIFEAYVPLHDTSTSSIIAVGEFYEDASILHRYLGQQAQRSWLLLTLCGLLIMATLAITFRSGARAFATQSAAFEQLRATHTHLLMASDQLADKLVTSRKQLAEIDVLIQRRIGQELHDGPAQLLGYLMLSLDELKLLLANSDRDMPALTDLQKAAERAQKEIRDLSNRLMQLTDHKAQNTTPTVKQIIADYTDRSKITVATHNIEICDLLPIETQNELGKIINEALNNGFKHADGKNQTVSVMFRGTDLVVTIQDDGAGLPDADTLTRKKAMGHMGLEGMKSRAKKIGGTLEIQPSLPMTLTISLPVHSHMR